MKLRPGLVVGVILAVALLTLFAGAAGATGTGSFSGAITPTACGPMHDVPVVAGDTTIDSVAAEYVAANDITLDLYGPSGALLVHGDTLTSPESVHYARADLAPGTYHLQVCPFAGGVVTTPYDYTGAWSVTKGPPVGIPGSDAGGEYAPPPPRPAAGKLQFSTATVGEAQRTAGEPLDHLGRNGDLW